MLKEELKDGILAAFTEAEWAAMSEKRATVPLREANRETLLQLRERDEAFPGEVDDRLVRSLCDYLELYLRREWAEEPLAHKYVVQACLALTFLFDKPMHPPETVGYHSLVENGTARYFCPAREPGPDSVCEFCCAESIDALKKRWASRTSETAERFGPVSALVQQEIFHAGFQDSGVVRTASLRFHEEVRKLCEENRCRCYDTSWACPPAVGTLKECRKQVMQFDRLQLYSGTCLLRSGMDFESVGAFMKEFKVRGRKLGKRLRAILPQRMLLLSNESCGQCDPCTWPNAPCRFPDELQPSIEGYGFMISELARETGVPYLNGKNTVTFFGAVLYNESTDHRI